jgi:hypothetical protein
MDYVIYLALTVQEAVNQEMFNNSFYTRFESSPKPRGENGDFRRQNVPNHTIGNFQAIKPPPKNLETRRLEQPYVAIIAMA